MTNNNGDTQENFAQTMSDHGLRYYYEGKWDEAIDCFQQSLEIFREIGNQQGIAQTMNNLGNIYHAQGKEEEAIDCYQQDLEISRMIGDLRGISETMNNLGNVYQAQGKWDEAIDCYQQSIQGSHQIDAPHIEADSWYNLGNTQAKIGDPAARNSYQNAQALYQQIKLTKDVQDCDSAIEKIDDPRKKTITFYTPFFKLVIVKIHKPRSKTTVTFL